MSSPQSLSDLLRRVEAAKGQDTSLSWEICEALGAIDKQDDGKETCQNVTGSIDAAIGLVERVLPGWDWWVFLDHDSYFARVEWFVGPGRLRAQGFEGAGIGPEQKALTLISAMLRALIMHTANPDALRTERG